MGSGTPAKERRLVARCPKSPGRVQVVSVLIGTGRAEALDFLVELGSEAIMVVKGLGLDLEDLGPTGILDMVKEALRNTGRRA